MISYLTNTNTKVTRRTETTAAHQPKDTLELGCRLGSLTESNWPCANYTVISGTTGYI
ncbi:uncharacterized protein Dsimw501_GD26878, isoform A [Drosophila simulans]|uniref:Uncharacterized protein, isoform A n=1 Tax=Drosophila simulans TaxID=7240 RepID=A0A0J9USR3_DROSI|nr:uncharacterized protein Dsimw501_GD26878, isoform A [Drosophila simulans]